MTVQPLEKAVPATGEIVPLTVDQYHRMIETGILATGEPIELLDGLLVHKDRGPGMTVNPIHASVVDQLNALLAPVLAKLGAYLRVQSPITIPPRHEPEPDAAIVRGRPADYGRRHPGPAEVSSVVEIAETSLVRDRTVKRRIYAAAGIRQYVLIDLAGRKVEVYEEPDASSGSYLRRTELRGDDPVPFLLPDGSRHETRARAILPA